MSDGTLSNLATAVCAVMGEIGYVRATGKNTQQNYNYTSDEDLLTAIQPLLVKHGLAILPTSYGIDSEQFTTSNGKTMWRSNVDVTYLLLHTSGECLNLHMGGSGTDSLDKDPYKALTGAYKYLLRQTFAVPTGDDAERDQPHGSTPPEPDGGRPNSPPVQSGRPADPETVKGWLLAKAERSNSTDRISDKQLRLLTWKLHDAVEPHSGIDVLIYVFGIGEPSELTKAQAGAVLDWLLDEQTEDGYSIYGREEARKIARTE